MDTAEVIEVIEKAGQAEGVYEVHTFDGTRNGNKIRIELQDGGPNYPLPSARYFCKVIQEDGKTACGNPDSTPRGAIINVHWNDLN